MKYDKAELVEVEDVLKKPTHKCSVCKTPTTKACARCKTSYFCSASCQKSAWKKHKKTCKAPTTKACARCKTSYFCSASCQKSAWKKHKKTCKAPTTPPATEAELRNLHMGMALLNMCIQRPGAGDGPTSVVLGFLFPFICPAY